MKIDYDISQVEPYINWDYFFYAWGMHNKPDGEKQQLQAEARDTLSRLHGRYRTHAVFMLYDAYSDVDDVVVYCSAGEDGARGSAGEDGLHGSAGNPPTARIPFLRQQQPDSDCLCLADFIAPKDTPADSPHSSLHTDKIGVFATSVDHGLETDFDHDAYEKMMVQLLADRLAEATAECMHESVRKLYWGYAPDESLTMHELHQEHFLGIRPAVGYPSLPDTSLNFVIDRLIDMRQIGIRLTESGAMKPHASVSGFMLAHPQARYFSLGKIGEDQLGDYARRRGLPVEVVRKFLASNL
ncbi:MAG: 5-methyltetrahydrofolate--homocysteine methyltransferase [Prevotella sp.]|nr:5-methyltetrahydrofolate--homocysteine methyltransferase [Prevotella sp.]